MSFYHQTARLNEAQDLTRLQYLAARGDEAAQAALVRYRARQGRLLDMNNAQLTAWATDLLLADWDDRDFQALLEEQYPYPQTYWSSHQFEALAEYLFLDGVGVARSAQYHGEPLDPEEVAQALPASLHHYVQYWLGGDVFTDEMLTARFDALAARYPFLLDDWHSPWQEGRFDTWVIESRKGRRRLTVSWDDSQGIELAGWIYAHEALAPTGDFDDTWQLQRGDPIQNLAHLDRVFEAFVEDVRTRAPEAPFG